MKELIKNEEQQDVYRRRARELVSQMTLREKISQMLHGAAAIDRLGVPAYNWWNEALHGVARAGTATVFPQAIAMAAAFDPDMMEQVGDAISTEARAKYNQQQACGDRDIYKGLTFWSPNINIFRDPRWGRGHETLGEDPWLTGELGKRFVNGLQGHDPKYLKAAACAKHYAVHSGPEDLRHRFDARVSQQDLWETYLPAFRTLVKEARVEAVMGAYNRVNGEPCNGSKTLLSDILLNKWGFDGYVTSDCWALKDFHEGHMVTDGPVESVALAVNNGCDLNCGDLFVYLEEAVEKGLVSEDTVTDAVVRLFTTRMRLGMFDPPEDVPFHTVSYDRVDSAEMRALNLRVSEKTLVLLKNRDNILPLDKHGLKCVGVIGPNANNRGVLVGNYEGTSSRYVTVLEGIQDYLGDGVRVMYSEGCHLYRNQVSDMAQTDDRFSEVRGVCAESDVVILCLGLDPSLEGEEGDKSNQFAGGDKPNLKLPGRQEELLLEVKKSGKPVILVLISGSALAVTAADELADAVHLAMYPGAQGGAAVARTLFGDVCPQGRLPITFYRSDDDLPPFTDYSMKGRTYRYMESEALYPFGYGLSYTGFRLDGAAVNTSELTEDGICITLTVENTGHMTGAETVQVYVKAERPGTPNPQLKGLGKVALEPGEKESVTLRLPLAAFALCDESGASVVEPGTYSVYVGASQPDSRSQALTGEKPRRLTVTASRRWEIDC